MLPLKIHTLGTQNEGEGVRGKWLSGSLTIHNTLRTQRYQVGVILGDSCCVRTRYVGTGIGPFC